MAVDNLNPIAWRCSSVVLGDEPSVRHQRRARPCLPIAGPLNCRLTREIRHCCRTLTISAPDDQVRPRFRNFSSISRSTPSAAHSSTVF
jgi:hypothetical protein